MDLFAGTRDRSASDRSIIRLQTKGGDPLVGYELNEKGTNKTTDFLGYTDWRGEFEIEASQSPIRTLLVRSGDRVIAKLPIVPGLRDEVVASMVDNRKRVETDGFLSGVQNALVDLVAQRESLTVRIRRLIASGEVERAEALLEELRDLPNQTDFQRDIQKQQQALNVTDPNLRKQIDTMFVETYRLLREYLDVNRVRELESELAAAKAR